MIAYRQLLDKIHLGKNPYDGFPANEWSGVWYGDPGAAREIFDKCIFKIRPRVVVEVGSFIGESAIRMARCIKNNGMDAAIVCVDTWYAGVDHWKGAREKIQPHFGRPDLYYRFIANVINNRCQDVIIPLAMDSLGGARVLKWLGVSADLVYVDASHEAGDVFRDYEFYWEILRSGGGMLVDDLSGHFPGVLHDFDAFLNYKNLKPSLIEGEKALLIKP